MNLSNVEDTDGFRGHREEILLSLAKVRGHGKPRSFEVLYDGHPLFGLAESSREYATPEYLELSEKIRALCESQLELELKEVEAELRTLGVEIDK